MVQSAKSGGRSLEGFAGGDVGFHIEYNYGEGADLYDPLTMPKELLDAHRANDEAVDACYGKRSFKSELERLEFLFALYRRYTEPLGLGEAKRPRRRRKLV